MFIYELMSGIYETIGREGEQSEEETEEEFDPHLHRRVEKPTSNSETMIHLLKGSIGAGILAMPDAVSRMGLFFGSLGIVVIGIVATYCIHLLIKAQYLICKRFRKGYMSYPRSMQVALESGPAFLKPAGVYSAYFVESVLIFWQLGLCCVYTIFFASNVKKVADYYGMEYSIRSHIVFSLPIFVLTNLIKDLKVLTPLSSISNTFTVFGFILVFFYLIEDDFEIDDRQLNLQSIQDIPVFVGITLFALEAVGVILALEYNMEDPKQFLGLFGLFNKGMFVILSLYIIVGVFGFLKYGYHTEASLTLNLPKYEKKAQTAQLLLASAIMLTFPLQNFVAYNIIWHKVKVKVPSANRILTDYCLRVILVVVPWALALALPSLGPFISLFGAFCLSLLAIIFPGIIDLCIWYPDNYGVLRYKLLRDYAVIIVGVLCLFSGCYTSFLEILHDMKSMDQTSLQDLEVLEE